MVGKSMLLRILRHVTVAAWMLVLLVRSDAQPVLAHDLELTAAEGRVEFCTAPLVEHNETCTCDAGFTWQTGESVCVQCAAGYYKQEPGFHVCTACPLYTTSFAGAAEADDCLCDAGYFNSASACETCAIGKYKSFVGNNSCVACPPNSATIDVAAVSAEACLCDVGYFAAAEGDASCAACPQNTFTQQRGETTCVSCPANSGTKGPASILPDCQCNAGYTQGQYGESFCVACKEHYYKPVLSMEPCTVCPKLMSSPSGSTSLANCTCDEGWQKKTPTECEPCAADSYCPGADAKHACPRNSTSPVHSASITACVCLPGFYWYHGTCEQCNEDHFCAGNIRTACPQNSTSPIASASVENCTCVPGFH